MKIVVLDGHTVNPGDNPWEPMAALGELTVHERTPADQVVGRAGEAEIILTNKTLLPADLLAQLPRLRFIAVLATGYNVVDVAAAVRLGIPVANVPEYGSDSVAQHTFALLLELTNHVALHDAAVKAGEWSAASDFSFWNASLTELAGKTMGIVGLGRIGRRVAAIARAFGMEIAAFNPRHRTALEGVPVAWLGLRELFAQADVVSLHSPLTAENSGFVNAGLLGVMKPDAFLLNTARGALVNETDLAQALNSVRIAGAGLDVAAVEPITPDNPLLAARNCLITPHIAWASLAARRRLMAAAARNVAAFLEGSPINVVNGEHLQKK
jgi:glycerate dehydrogenase